MKADLTGWSRVGRLLGRLGILLPSPVGGRRTSSRTIRTEQERQIKLDSELITRSAGARFWRLLLPSAPASDPETRAGILQITSIRTDFFYQIDAPGICTLILFFKLIYGIRSRKAFLTQVLLLYLKRVL